MYWLVLCPRLQLHVSFSICWGKCWVANNLCFHLLKWNTKQRKNNDCPDLRRAHEVWRNRSQTLTLLTRVSNIINTILFFTEIFLSLDLHDWACTAPLVEWGESSDTTELGSIPQWHRGNFQKNSRSDVAR